MDIDYITVRGGGEWVQEIKGHGVFRDTNVVITEVYQGRLLSCSGWNTCIII